MIVNNDNLLYPIEPYSFIVFIDDKTMFNGR